MQKSNKSQLRSWWCKSGTVRRKGHLIFLTVTGVVATGETEQADISFHMAATSEEICEHLVNSPAILSASPNVPIISVSLEQIILF